MPDAHDSHRTTSTPASPDGQAGVGRSPRSGRARVFTHPVTWLALIGLLWGLPLLKSLRATYPEPPPGFDRPAEAFSLVDSEGRPVALDDLQGFLLVVQPLDKHREDRGSPIVAADAVAMAGPGELVYFVASREAAEALEERFVPVDHAIVGLVDHVTLSEEGP